VCLINKIDMIIIYRSLQPTVWHTHTHTHIHSVLHTHKLSILKREHKSIIETITMSSKIEIGSRVVVTGLQGKKGDVRFMGRTKFADGEWIGIALETPDGKNDGSVGDVRYFTCEPLHGLFVKSAQVRLDREISVGGSGVGTASASAASDTNARLGTRFLFRIFSSQAKSIDYFVVYCSCTTRKKKTAGKRGRCGRKCSCCRTYCV
jgi:hypothetical protein